MRYMLLVYGAEDAPREKERDACTVESVQLCQELSARGQLLGASPLRPVSLATSVRIREGRRLVTDGPFAETREQLGGYYLVDVADLDEAIAISARIPGAAWGTIEIRPVGDLPGLEEVAGLQDRPKSS